MEEGTARQGAPALLGKHWSGCFSLGRACVVLMASFAPALGFLLLPALQGLPPRYPSAAALGLSACTLALVTWAARGTWASATRHVARGGRRAWARAAKMGIVLGALSPLSDPQGIGENLVEHARVAFGGQAGPEYTVQVSADRTSVALQGGMNDGLSEALARALESAPNAATVVLTSKGGWIREGRLVAKLISDRRLATYVQGECTSACTIAFLAGRDRGVDPEARIGFHRFKAVGRSGRSSSGDAIARTLYERAGVRQAFIEKIVATPYDTVWYPTLAELQAANVVTRGRVIEAQEAPS